MWCFLLSLIFPFIGVLSLKENFHKWSNVLSSICYIFFAFISFALLQLSCFDHYICFRSFCLTNIFQTPSFDRNDKFNCENCGTQSKKPNLARHKKRCSVGPLCCTQCFNFSRKTQGDLKYQIVKKHNARKPVLTYRCILYYQQLPRFYALRQQKSCEYGLATKTANALPEDIINQKNDLNLEEKLLSCKHFLVDSELERVRHKVFNYTVVNLN